MAIVTASQPIDMLAPEVWWGDVTLAAPTQIVIDNGQGRVATYTGTFQYTSNSVAGGILTGFSQASSSGIDFTVTDFSISASLAYAIIQSGDAQAAWRLVLAGDDIINGSSGSDILAGFGGNDTFVTGGGLDIVFGGTGDDTLLYNVDNDTFFGESGFDSVVIDAARTDFEVNRLDMASHLVQHINATDDVAVNTVERLIFQDNEIIALDVDAGGHAGMAFRMYEAALDRDPDPDGLAGWINYLDNGGTALDMAAMFLGSVEFSTRYGALDNTAFVQSLYNNVLDRDGEPAGVQGWVNGLNHGLTRADILLGFSESQENIQNLDPLVTNGIAYTEWWLS